MKIGLQTNLFTDEMHQHHFPELLTTIKVTGYDGFEIGVQRVDVTKSAEITQQIKAVGLEVAGVHTGLQLDNRDWLAGADAYVQRSAEFAAAVGATFVGMSGRRIDKTEAQLVEMVEMLNRFGSVVRSLGMDFCYHHHDWEFADDWHELRFLIENTDPAHVGILSDIGWIVKANQNISAVLDRYGDRISHFHVKDVPPEGWFTELGRGIVPLDEFVGKLAQVKPGWLIVERDEALENSAESAQESRDYLRSNFGI